MKNKLLQVMHHYGIYYNIDEVIGHMTAFNPKNMKHIKNMLSEENDENLLDHVINACNIIDLNEEKD